MIFTAVTGALRSPFASPAPVAARWRAMHMLAYPAWCFALVHGLYAGRQAKPIFTILVRACACSRSSRPWRCARRPARSSARSPPRSWRSWGPRNGWAARSLDASRARLGESSLPGYESPSGGRPARGDAGIPPQRGAQTPSPFYDAPASRTMTPEPAQDEFAAAYRAVPTPQAQAPYMDQTARMDLSMDTQATAAMPRVDGSTSGSWPIPSPPPVGEAPVSAYDPMQRHRIQHPDLWQSGRGRVRHRVMCTTPVSRMPPMARTTRMTRTTAVPPLTQSPVPPTTSTHRVRANLGTRLPEALSERGSARRPRSPRGRASRTHVGFRPCRAT